MDKWIKGLCSAILYFAYSFVDYCESDTPYMNLENFWNPFVSTETVVTNSIEMGISNASKNIILTGSNTGGKSTLLKGIMISILLAQTFGIAPASAMTFTPYAVIGSSLNVSDDTAAGHSLFKAEVMRAQSLLQTAQQQATNCFSFLVIDELFTGTSADKGASAACNVAKRLAEFDNTLYILATHFPEVTNLERDTHGVCKNYKIEILKDAQGNLVRPFKIEEGISTNNVADEILKAEIDGVNFTTIN